MRIFTFLIFIALVSVVAFLGLFENTASNSKVNNRDTPAIERDFAGISLSSENAQPKDEVTTWDYKIKENTLKVGEPATIEFKVVVKKNWYIYATDFDPDCGPQVTTITLSPTDDIRLKGTMSSPKSIREIDEVFGCEITKFKKEGVFSQQFIPLKEDGAFTVSFEYQVCTEGLCVPYEREFMISFKAVKAALSNTETTSVATTSITQEATTSVQKTTNEKEEKNGAKNNSNAPKENNISKQDSFDTEKPIVDTVITPSETKSTNTSFSVPRKAGFEDIEIIRFDKEEVKTSATFADLFWFMLIAFVSGLVALITPCVFPMIPMTVTFFTHSSQSRAQAISKALLYGVFIIIIYVLFGSIIALFNGPDFANWLATSWVPNLIFFFVFLIFAVAFLGMFEITLPSWMVNKVDSQADKGGFAGIFFMAFTLVLVSFSCTGPIVGTILVEAAGGEVLKPIVGMFGFSLAFAIPFTLFAIFPSWLHGLPKSGGWLNTVKVVLGLLELALALKFLSLADQAYHWNLLDREVFLAFWIAIFGVMFIYLIGKIYFPHDDKVERLSVPRGILAIIVFTFVIYMIPGMWGAPLKVLSGILPPITGQDFDLSEKIMSGSSSTCNDQPMYADKLHLPHGLEGYFDLREAIACAAKQDKPIFLDFTGHGCANCRDMEMRVWSEKTILSHLQNDFVMLALYGDDKTISLPENEQYTSSFGKEITSLGKQASDFMYDKFKQQAQPFYVLLKVDKEASTADKIVLRELQPPIGYELNKDVFKTYLEKGLTAYKK